MQRAAAIPGTPTRESIRAALSILRKKARRGDVFTAERLAAAAEVQPFNPAKYGPVTFSPRPPAGPPQSRTPAAVLVPLVEHSAGFAVLLTQRVAGLKAHAGQISFPGGRLEPGDPDAEAGALREAHEEIGLAPPVVEVLGQLDPYITSSGFEVTPVVGAMTPPLALKPDPSEVAEIFEVPLAFFLDPANHHRHSRVVNGTTRAYYAMPYGDRYIWGATAGMLLNLYEVLTAPM